MKITPPIAKRDPFETTLHGYKKIDQYAWLRDSNWQTVMQDPSALRADIRNYLEQENAYTEAAMQDTKQLQETLFEEMKNRIKQDDATVPAKDGEYYYQIRYEVGAEHPCYCRYSESLKNKEQVLLNANDLAKEHEYFDMGDCEHSPDHRYLAYCVDTKGSEFYTLHLLDLASGKALTEVIENIQGNFVWAMDGQTIMYTTLDANHRPDKVYRHQLHTSPDSDVLVYQEYDPGFFVGLDRTESNRFILISVHDHTTSEIHYIDAHNPIQAAQLFQTRENDIEYEISDHGTRWFITTNADECEDYKIMSAPLDKTSRDNWNDFYVPAKGILLKGIILYKKYLVRSERVQGLPKIIVTTLGEDKESLHEYAIKFAEQAYELGADSGFEFDTDTLRFSYTSMTTPTQIFDFDMHTQKRELRKQQEVPSGHSPQDYVTKRIFAEAPDQTRIPISILYHRDTPIDGSAPLLLYGYGSYGSSMPASFSTSRLSLVNRGFVYAIAHIRGGMELGYSWYKNGKREHKKNTFHDFIASAKYLVKSNYTSIGKITIHGGSAGGMLVGAVINMQPDLFHAAIADVPFVDVLTTMCDDSLPLTPPEWPEWGNPIKSPQDYATIKSYSPYDNIGEHRYPHLLVTAGLTDPRVTYWEPAKWVAKLRAQKADNNILLLKTNMEAGHAGVSGRFDSLKEVALIYAFILKAQEKHDWFSE